MRLHRAQERKQHRYILALRKVRMHGMHILDTFFAMEHIVVYTPTDSFASDGAAKVVVGAVVVVTD